MKEFYNIQELIETKNTPIVYESFKVYPLCKKLHEEEKIFLLNLVIIASKDEINSESLKIVRSISFEVSDPNLINENCDKYLNFIVSIIQESISINNGFLPEFEYIFLHVKNSLRIV